MEKKPKNERKMSTKRLVCLILAALMILGSLTTLVYFIVQGMLS